MRPSYDQVLLDERTVSHAGNSLLQTSNEDLLVDRVGEPGVDQSTSGHGSIDTNTTTGGNAGGEVGGDGEDLAGVIGEVGLDRSSTRAGCALSLERTMRQGPSMS